MQCTQDGTQYWTLIFKLWGQDRLGTISSDHLNKTDHCISPIFSYIKHICLGIWLEDIWVKCAPRAKTPTSSLGSCSHGWFPTPTPRIKNRCLFSHLKTWQISHLVLTRSHCFTPGLFLYWPEATSSWCGHLVDKIEPRRTWCTSLSMAPESLPWCKQVLQEWAACLTSSPSPVHEILPVSVITPVSPLQKACPSLTARWRRSWGFFLSRSCNSWSLHSEVSLRCKVSLFPSWSQACLVNTRPN